VAKDYQLPTKTIFQWTGQVIHGESMGKTIGFPTANLDLVPQESELKTGVYLGQCQLANSLDQYYCLIYFGPKLVLGQTTNVFEVNLFNFDQQIYGQTVVVGLQKYLRAPKKFAHFEELKEQLTNDLYQAQSLIKTKG